MVGRVGAPPRGPAVPGVPDAAGCADRPGAFDRNGPSAGPLARRRSARTAQTSDMEPMPWQPPSGFPDADDVAIVAAALAACAERFVTCDRALLALGAVDGMRIVDPRSCYTEPRGLR